MARALFKSSRLAEPVPLLVLLTIVLLLGLAIPGVTPWYLGPVAVLQTLLSAAPFAIAYLAAAIGWGTVLRLLWRGVRNGWAIQLGIGLAVMLFLSHLMGVAGLLRTGAMGLAMAWLPIGIGLGLLGLAASRQNKIDLPGAPVGRSYLILTAAPALAVLILAACVPPGALWTSEARGFDVLSYHLQLPREWLAAGRLRPLEHNAYSWLPSYMEAAYTHLGAMSSFVARDPFTQADGVATIASQLLHALMAIGAAASVGALTYTILRKHSDQPNERRFASTLAAILFLTTPWVIVTGSLAYNEMAICLFLAVALFVCESESLSHTRRGALIGLLVGAACCAKPTALFMVGAPVGVLLLIRTPRREWIHTMSAAGVVGFLMLVPWLARNAAVNGNPVFPYLASMFGSGHWSALEVARWKLGHHETAGVLARIQLLFSGRGFAHQQWLLASICAALGLLFGLLRQGGRARGGVFACLLLLQCALWMGIGHLQSRFLLPTIVIITTLFALTWGAHKPGGQRMSRIGGAMWIAFLLVVPIRALLLNARTGIGSIVVAGIPALSGEAIRPFLTELAVDDERAKLPSVLAPQQFINLDLAGPIRRLYLLGDSTPFYYQVPILYHTTWDPSPLGALLRQPGMTLAQAVQRLAAPPPEGLGISHVLINFGELRRLQSDHWYDPDVTVATAEALIERHGRTIQEWQPSESARIVLIELVPSSH